MEDAQLDWKIPKSTPPRFPSAKPNPPRSRRVKIKTISKGKGPGPVPGTTTSKPLLLHLGCGELIGPHWVNIDSSPNVFLDNHRLIKRLLLPFLPSSSKIIKFRTALHLDLRCPRWQFADDSVDGIFSSHFFEHLTLESGTHVLNESFRILKPGARIRFLVPSIEAQVRKYLQLKEERNRLAATNFAQMTNALPDFPPGPWWYRLYFQFYDKNRHKMFYDSDSLKYYFELAGFTQISTRNYLDSKLPFLAEIEKEDRYEGAFCIEGNKPK